MFTTIVDNCGQNRQRHSKYSAMLSKIHFYRRLFLAILPTGNFLIGSTQEWYFGFLMISDDWLDKV